MLKPKAIERLKQELVIPTVEIDDRQMSLWTETRAMLRWQAAAFTHIFYRMLNPGQTESVLYFVRHPSVPTMATDSIRILANPEFFFGLALPYRVAGTAHEIGHAILMHCEASLRFRERGVVTDGRRTKPYHAKFANCMQDYVLNDMIHEGRIGKLHPNWLHNPAYINQNMSWVDAYLNYYDNPPPDCPVNPKQKPKGKGPGNDGEGATRPGRNPDGSLDPEAKLPAHDPKAPKPKVGKGTEQFDEHFEPGELTGERPDQAERPTEQQWRMAVAEAKVVAEQYGKLPAGMKKAIDEFLQPKVTWTDHIEGLFARKVGSGGYDFRRFDRKLAVRDIYSPARSGHGAGTIGVFMDCSGSIYAVKSLIERFFAELAGILGDVKPRKIFVVWCDSIVQRVDEIEDEAALLKCFYQGVPGGGGTDFRPPFKWLEDNKIEDLSAVVYLTDGDGTFSKKNPVGEVPVIWGHIGRPEVKYPFGDVVVIPTDGGTT